MTPERHARICSVLDRRQPDLTVVLDQVHKSRNLAAITRTCDAVGVGILHAVMPEGGYQTYAGTTASADKWVEVQYHSSATTPLKLLIDKGYQLVAAQKKDGARHFREIDYCKPTAIVMGAELDGISDEAGALVHESIYLPMVGMVESYNVSVACAGILLEAERQREVKGLYNNARLEKSLWDLNFFRWAHPVIAEYCDKKKIPYPPVREDGEIVNLSRWYASVQHE